MHASSEIISCELGPTQETQLAPGTPPQDQMNTEMVEHCLLSPEAFAEFLLLLPNFQLVALEKVASTLHVTTGHLLRLLIRNWLGALDQSPPPETANGNEISGLHSRIAKASAGTPGVKRRGSQHNNGLATVATLEFAEQNTP